MCCFPVDSAFAMRWCHWFNPCLALQTCLAHIQQWDFNNLDTIDGGFFLFWCSFNNGSISGAISMKESSFVMFSFTVKLGNHQLVYVFVAHHTDTARVSLWGDSINSIQENILVWYIIHSVGRIGAYIFDQTVTFSKLSVACSSLREISFEVSVASSFRRETSSFFGDSLI